MSPTGQKLSQQTKKGLAQHSKSNPNWGTPKHVADWAHQVMGGIDLDPCTSVEQNKIIGATRIYTERGELQPWEGRVFCNPPGGQVKPFWEHAQREILAGRVTALFWLGFSTTQLSWLPNLRGGHLQWNPSIALLRKRIAFLDEQGMPQNRPSHYNYLWFWQNGFNPQWSKTIFPHCNILI